MVMVMITTGMSCENLVDRQSIAFHRQRRRNGEEGEGDVDISVEPKSHKALGCQLDICKFRDFKCMFFLI